MSVNSKMTSIARRINMSFWLKNLWGTICLDIFLVAMVGGVFLKWQTDRIPEESSVKAIELQQEGGYEELLLVIVDSEGIVYEYELHRFLDYVLPPMLALGVIQLLDLIGELFDTGSVRKKLKPLNDLALQAEKLSAMPLDAAKFESLEHAIDRLSPDLPDARLSTGDKDLESIEVAINNLICRMRESQKQQARFVSDASHELRTPIAVIQGYVNMLDRWGKEDESVLNESIEALKSESEHMRELVEQLLFLARGENGKNTLHYEAFDLSKVIREVWEESVMIDPTHFYEWKEAEEVPVMIYGDAAMLKQSMRILVQNAAKYSPEKAVISLRVTDRDGRYGYVVQDEGIGMSQEELRHIFEPFYRSDKARSRGGSGLGLSIAKWIIDAHEGTIEVLSSPDLGTRFTVLI